jgi:hypothetical protein
MLSIYVIPPTAKAAAGTCSASNRNEYARQKRKYFEGKTLLSREADNLTAICEPTV